MDFHLIQIIVIMLIMPAIFSIMEIVLKNKKKNKDKSNWIIIVKWVLFWSVGIRSLSAGLVQLIHPQYTAQAIFELSTGQEFYIFIRELGVANIAIGLTAIISVKNISWRIPASFISLIFNLFLSVNHILHFQAGANEFASLGGDLFIVIILSAFLIKVAKNSISGKTLKRS